jgi:oxygen-independent coproporphyrinogen III oxidase
MPLGIYVSVPFCRTKCSYCNFASDVFSRAIFESYVNRVCADIENAPGTAERMGGRFENAVDSIYLGGGTPTVLEALQLKRLFDAIRSNFSLLPDAEITVECAPGTLTGPMIETLCRCGVNRVSLGVQSFVDEEAAAVGRLHKRQVVLDEIVRLRGNGIENISIDLIAGLPHQTRDSWQFSLDALLATGVPHASIYMLEVDEDSRLGRELIAGGTRYHAHFVPDEDLTAEFYLAACETLAAAGLGQYEISNFARDGWRSRHNMKYWTRQPYLGFGVDAHSMLEASDDPYTVVRAGEMMQAEEIEQGTAAGGSAPCELVAADLEAVRFSTTDRLEEYVAGGSLKRTPVTRHEALEETFFLGLRLNKGVDLEQVRAQFGARVVTALGSAIGELATLGLIDCQGQVIRLTPEGRLLSNEVFEKFLTAPVERT